MQPLIKAGMQLPFISLFIGLIVQEHSSGNHMEVILHLNQCKRVYGVYSGITLFFLKKTERKTVEAPEGYSMKTCPFPALSWATVKGQQLGSLEEKDGFIIDLRIWQSFSRESRIKMKHTWRMTKKQIPICYSSASQTFSFEPPGH